MQRIQGFAPAGATVSVFFTGTGNAASILADDLSTPTNKANPFTADATTGYWFFYARRGLYDVQLSGAGVTTPYLTLVAVSGGLGNGLISQQPQESGLINYTSDLHSGRLVYVLDSRGGLRVFDGNTLTWKSVMDFGHQTVASVAALPAFGIPGRLCFVGENLDGSPTYDSGLYVDTGSRWLPLSRFPLPTNLPSIRGQIAVRAAGDGVQGLWTYGGGGGIAFGVNGEATNVVEFGAVRNGVTDDLAAIQAAIDAAAQAASSYGNNLIGGTVWFPPGLYAISGPIKVRTGVMLVGGGGVTLTAASGFSGDSVFRAYTRDDNTAGNTTTYGYIGHITVDFTKGAAVTLPANFACIDLTGWAESTIERVNLIGTATASGAAIRLASNNYSSTTNKICYHNHILQLEGKNWITGIQVVKPVGKQVDNNCFLGFNFTVTKLGVDFSGAVDPTLRLMLMNGSLNGNNIGGSVAVTAPATVPLGVHMIQVDQAAYASAGLLDNSDVYTTAVQADSASGTTAAAPLASGGTSAQNFVRSIYLKIVSGTVLVSGANTFTYTLLNSPAGNTVSLTPVSGLPTKAISLQGSLVGNTLTVTLVIDAGLNLAADFVFRARQEAP